MNPELLSSRGEQAWTWLRRHLDRAEGFWLGFVFTDNFATAEILATRAQANRKAKKQPFAHFSPGTPEELSSLLDRIEQEASGPLGCTWIAAVSLSQPGWEDAWGRFLQALNHRRDYLRDRLGGLVIVAPPPAKAYAQRYSADLWSVRDLLVELPTEIVPTLPMPSEFQHHYETPRGALSYGDVEAALADEVTAVTALPSEQLATTSRDRAAHLTERALAADANQLAAVLLLARARGYAAAGDLAAALDLVHAALRLQGIDNAARFQLLDLASELAINASEPNEAIETGKNAVAIARLMDDLVSIALSLSRVGDAYVAQDDMVSAREYYLQSLEIRETLAKKQATESSLVDMATTALELGNTYRSDDPEEAAAARQYFSEALEVFDRLLKRAESRSTRLGLARSFLGLGRLELIKRDTASAIRYFAEATRSIERLTTDYPAGTAERALLVATHAVLGSVYAAQGDSVAAAQHLRKALEILREFGDDGSITELKARLDEIERNLPS